jgi:hypothetical protein
MNMTIDWSRRPRTTEEGEFVADAFGKVIDFLTSMESVRDRYASEEARDQLRRFIQPVMLGALDAHIAGVDLAVTKTAEPWDQVVQTLNALCDVAELMISEEDDQTGFTVELNPDLASLKTLKAAALDHSQIFDVHRSSDHPEVNAFVDRIYAEHFGSGSALIQKKHIKVLLLDLYVRWVTDPAC